MRSRRSGHFSVGIVTLLWLPNLVWAGAVAYDLGSRLLGFEPFEPRSRLLETLMFVAVATYPLLGLVAFSVTAFFVWHDRGCHDLASRCVKAIGLIGVLGHVHLYWQSTKL